MHIGNDKRTMKSRDLPVCEDFLTRASYVAKGEAKPPLVAKPIG
jgi:hypothetical protein